MPISWSHEPTKPSSCVGFHELPPGNNLDPIGSHARYEKAKSLNALFRPRSQLEASPINPSDIGPLFAPSYGGIGRFAGVTTWLQTLSRALLTFDFSLRG